MTHIGKILILATLVSVPAVSIAQGPPSTPFPLTTFENADSATNEPKAVEIPLYAGATIKSVLDALIKKGFKIKYSAEKVLPTMTLLEKPKSERIDKLLNEILSPYDMHASQMARGGWVINTKKKKKPKT